ncbi:MAG: SMC family ATPase, partial [Proteobacteria bacterium]
VLKTELSELLQIKKFETILEARRVGLSADQISSLENERRSFEKEWATVHSRFSELSKKLESSDQTELEKISEIESAFQAVDAERTDRKAELLSLGQRIRDWQTALKKLAKLDLDVTEFGKRHAVIGKLAETAAGRFPNLSRVNFQRFILASRLDEVLEQASRRLYVMSRGQFTLRRAQQAEDKRKSAGLDLEVEDSVSGTSRATASLSGGEGFLASLSLALGLADVVQNHLGGIRLDAVFVDEGFGTLDPEALEQAMRILSDLQAGGRLVGIISHVPELRDQISRRLLIRKTAEGSDISWEG